jgi:hypothetical protein
MPRTKNPDVLRDYIRRFELSSTSGDASGWVAARAAWGAELRAFFVDHAPARVRELDTILERPIPPAFHVWKQPPAADILEQQRQHSVARDTLAREAMTEILVMLREVEKARSAAPAKSPRK